jgi:GntR family transcriptional regulator
MPSKPSALPAAALFTITTGSAEPIYQQIAEQTRRMVSSGLLSAGDDLPSVREVAQALAVNPMTVSKAYSQLEAAGVLERKRGVGMTVAAQHNKPGKLPQRLAFLKPTLEKAAAEAAQLEITPQQALQLFESILKGKL